MNLDPLRTFLQQHRECFQIPMQFSVSILFTFHWEIGSIINGFYTVTPNSLKPSQCTPTHQELYKDIKSFTWSTLVWAISAWQNKTKHWVCHTVALSFTLQKYLKANYGNSNISPCKNIIFKKSSIRNHNPSRYYN